MDKDARPNATGQSIDGRLIARLFAAWLVPGLGHALLRRWGRAAVFFALVVLSLVIGTSLDGKLASTFAGQPLAMLATLGCMGAGLPYFLLYNVLGYAGTIDAPGYEYGSAFILTAGLMNLLLILDVWDIGTGQKE